MEEHPRGHEEAPGDENPADARRRGTRRAAGADTPAGPRTDRTVARAKQELERQEEEGERGDVAAEANVESSREGR